MKTFKEIEAFVRKAMEKNLYVFNNSIFTENITVVSNSNTRITLELLNFGKCLRLLLGEDDKCAVSKSITLDDREIELFKLLKIDVSDYENSKVKEIFDNFFEKEDNSDIKTVDDLEFDNENHN